MTDMVIGSVISDNAVWPARAVLLTITGGTVEKAQPQSVACIALFARLHATEIGPVILESSFWYRSKRPSCFIRSSSGYAWTLVE